MCCTAASTAASIWAILMLSPVIADPQSLENSQLRIGDGTEDSVTSSGTISQPWAFLRGTWTKLTNLDSELDFALSVSGAEQTIGSSNPATIDTSAFTSDSSAGGVDTGTGTITATNTFLVSGADVTLVRRYSLTPGNNGLTIEFEISAASAPATDVAMWVGTHDDQIGTSASADNPDRFVGTVSTISTVSTYTINFSTGAISNPSTHQELEFTAGTAGAAVSVQTGTAGVQMWSDSPGATGLISNTTGFSSIINMDPSTTFSTTGILESDGSYGLYLPFGNLSNGQTSTKTINYRGFEVASPTTAPPTPPAPPVSTTATLATNNIAPTSAPTTPATTPSDSIHVDLIIGWSVSIAVIVFVLLVSAVCLFFNPRQSAPVAPGTNVRNQGRNTVSLVKDNGQFKEEVKPDDSIIIDINKVTGVCHTTEAANRMVAGVIFQDAVLRIEVKNTTSPSA